MQICKWEISHLLVISYPSTWPKSGGVSRAGRGKKSLKRGEVKKIACAPQVQVWAHDSYSFLKVSSAFVKIEKQKRFD